MNTTSLHIKVEPSTKEEAQKIADELGMSLSAVMKALLKQFIRTKHLSVGITEVPNAYLKKSLKQSDEAIKNDKTLSFKNGQEALGYINSLIDHDKQQKR